MHWDRHPLSRHFPACLGQTPPVQTSQHALGQTPPGQTYPSMHWGRHTPSPGRHPRAGTPAGRRLLLRTVRILLECILVKYVLYNVIRITERNGSVTPFCPLVTMLNFTVSITDVTCKQIFNRDIVALHHSMTKLTHWTSTIIHSISIEY